MNMFPKKHVKCNFPDKPLHIYIYVYYVSTHKKLWFIDDSTIQK